MRHLVELHGGTVSVASAGENHGTTFWLRLSRHIGEAPEVASAPVRSVPEADNDLALEPITGIHVLIVEDDADSRNVLAVLLQRLGALVESVASAKEAYDRVMHRRPDVLVSDIGMPDFDGYELIRRIRALPSSTKRNLPAIALTAYARADDRQRALLAGFQMHVAKPVEPRELIAGIASLLNLSGQVGGRPHP